MRRGQKERAKATEPEREERDEVIHRDKQTERGGERHTQTERGAEDLEEDKRSENNRKRTKIRLIKRLIRRNFEAERLSLIAVKKRSQTDRKMDTHSERRTGIERGKTKPDIGQHRLVVTDGYKQGTEYTQTGIQL